MKEFFLVIKNENGDSISEAIMVALCEIPHIGDYVVIDDENNITKNDQTSYLNFVCLLHLPESETSGFRFKVVGRNFFRKNGEASVCLELQHEPELTN